MQYFTRQTKTKLISCDGNARVAHECWLLYKAADYEEGNISFGQKVNVRLKNPDFINTLARKASTLSSESLSSKKNIAVDRRNIT